MKSKERLIDGNALIKIMREEDKLLPNVPWSTTAVHNYIERLPAVEVVRCKDCEHWHSVEIFIDGEIFGNYFCDKNTNITKPDDFCSLGKRKDQN